MHTSIQEIIIEDQRSKAFKVPDPLDIVETCKIGKGILKFSANQIDNLVQTYKQSTLQTSFFIPASGSGSRMFEFLYNFLNDPTEENRGQVERFIHHIDDFAFSKKIPEDVLFKLKNYDLTLEDFVEYLLNENGLNLGNLPKGMIPFHRLGPFIFSPFQEHLLQGLEIANRTPQFHFTINKRFESQIHYKQEIVTNLISKKVSIDYSFQDSETDSYIFDANQNPVTDSNGNYIKRPSGHGALLNNLYQTKGDLIFIKNIDNIQHYNHSKDSVETIQMLGGLLIKLEQERNQLIANFSREELDLFNKKYELFIASELENLSDKEIIELLDLPIRICGMVKNEGEPGGGPFWMRKNGVTRKQIIEKSQINTRDKQYNLLINSTHFNPVLMAVKMTNSHNEKVDISTLVDKDQYFKVSKTQKGKKVHFVEQPGLWNGSMYNWLTVFVEIPRESFSPVKTILDLLNPIHKEK